MDETLGAAGPGGPRASDRRAFLAKTGVAAAAAGGAMLLGSSPAGASTPDAEGPIDASVPLRTFDWSAPSATIADLGSGSVSVARLMVNGPIVWMTYRCLVGTGASLGTNPLCLIGSDLPEGYQPALPGTDIQPIGQVGALGAGLIVDPSRHTDTPPGISGYPCFIGWDDASGAGFTAPVGFMGITEPSDIANGAGLLNEGGHVPWLDGIRDATWLTMTIVFELGGTQVSPTNETTTISPS